MRGKRGWGEKGEDVAYNLLKKKGYLILQRNFRCKLGEIDLVAKDKDTLVFVEVKTRWSKKYGLPQEAVNSYKINKIKRVGDYYLLTHPNSPTKQRIDVVSIEYDNNNLINAKIFNVI